MTTLSRMKRCTLLAIALLLWSVPMEAMEDFTELSIEELANIEVTSVSRKPQKLSHSATAIFVITGDEIRRSGVTSIPDALRMVPGIQVARISSSKWAITSRGFNSRYANKLLVQMDGRTLYSPLFSGVFWEAHTTLMEDIDRIEVIRGPGASLWGANAVNGIINIITKETAKTQGALATNGVGTLDRTNGGVRYGAPAGGAGHYRLYTTYGNREESVDSDGKGVGDAWDTLQAGFRSDLTPNRDTQLTFQGDAYTGRTNEETEIPTLDPPYALSYENENDTFGLNLLSRFSRDLSATSELSLQLYYDRSEKEEAQLSWEGDLVDIDLQHRFEPLDGHEIIWGLGYRYYTDTLNFTDAFSMNTPTTRDHLSSAFVQDAITLTPTVQVTLGTKVEHNDYTQFEIQPNARVLWMPNTTHSLWAAVSRAVRTPNRSETQVRIRNRVIPPGTPENPSSLPVDIIIQGNEDLTSEKLLALETGYRMAPEPSFSLDLTLFYYFYDDLHGYLPSPPQDNRDETPPHIVQTSTIVNAMEGQTWGLELASNWDPMPLWRLQSAYTLFQARFNNKTAYASSVSVETDNASPTHQCSLRSGFDLPRHVTLDLWLRYVDGIQDKRVDAYTELDARIGWKPMKGLELSLTGQNLLNKRHPEFIETLLWVSPTEVERSVHAQATLSF
ncbi:TonB-dependent receptor [Desulfoluna limicola]|uniref:TonB-dependent receptor n=1 Tax=Desulfoluna limicola TaxID=2810562 RepID=A0ABM7PN00_9BACT|nr:TonB-dependent receptor [Desulfoluna limicola]BCS98456.1 TonB-dependent receptor [Desulfoluna limicola]